MASDLGAEVWDAIAAAAKKLRSFLNNDYGKYESTLHALDVVEAQLRALPLGRGRARPSGGWRHVDGGASAVDLAGFEWMLRLDEATNALEDLVQDMEAAAARAQRWWWRAAAAADAVASWLGSDDENALRMEGVVGRLASVYVQGGEIFEMELR